MADKGWIKLHRQLQDCSIWYGERFSKGQAWVDLLLLANHSDKKILFNGSMITVQRGQYLTSMVKLAEKWGWNRKTVCAYLKLLENNNMITRVSDNTKTLITIENYEIYQYVDNSTDNLADNKTNNLTDIRTVDHADTRTDTNKNVKNDKNVNNNRGMGGSYSFEKNTNVNNFMHVLFDYKDCDYINSNSELFDCLKNWFEYKDNKKPKSNNHYGTQKGIEMLLNKVVTKCKEHGVQAVVETINDSISNNYQGIVWDWLEKKRGNYGNTKPERRNIRTDDDEIDPIRAEILAMCAGENGM